MSYHDLEKMQQEVLIKLQALNPALTYHCLEHTIDVIAQSIRIGQEEGIGERETFLLKVAAVYHDTGFLRGYANHEILSCEIFLEDAINFNINDAEKELVNDLILATKVPQLPTTLLQQIICDADLDYLGREDFSTISNNLKMEFLHFGIVADLAAWEKLQMKFLTNHQYHTKSSQLLREPVKKLNIAGL